MTIHTIRQSIKETLAKLADPTLTNRSHKEVKAELRRQFEHLSAKGADLARLGLNQVVNGSAFDPLDPTEGAPNPVWAARGAAENAGAFVAYLLGPGEMVKRFEPLIAELPDAAAPAARAQRVADLRAELDALEIDEEAVLRELDREGIDWDPRPGQRADLAILVDEEAAE